VTKPGCEGEDHWNSKLSEEEVQEIRRVYDKGIISQAELAIKYGVSRSTIHKIVKRKLWTTD
jgi:DNA invertase Pin-like site-specific DNA recombinase